MDRRLFLAASGSVFVPSLFGEEAQTYHQWWAQNVKDAKGEPFQHATHKPILSEKDYDPAVLLEVLKHLAREGKGKLYDTDLGEKVAFTSEMSAQFVPLTWNKEVLEHYVETATKVVEEFYQAVGKPESTPTLDFILLEKDTPIKAPGDVVPVYLAHHKQGKFHAEMKRAHKQLLVGKPLMTFEGKMDLSFNGEVLAQGTYLPQNGSWHYQRPLDAVFVYPGLHEIGSLAAVLSEVLPVTLRKAHEAYGTQLLAEKLPEGTINQTLARQCAKDALHYAEGFIEGAIDMFFLEHLSQFGFTQAQWNQYIIRTKEKYKHCGLVRGKVCADGLEKTWDRYVEGDMTLFER